MSKKQEKVCLDRKTIQTAIYSGLAFKEDSSLATWQELSNRAPKAAQNTLSQTFGDQKSCMSHEETTALINGGISTKAVSSFKKETPSCLDRKTIQTALTFGIGFKK